MSELTKKYLDQNQPTNGDSREHKDYCSSCDKEQNTEVRTIEEAYSVRGENIKILADVRVCIQCNSPVFDEELDTNNIEKAYSIYRSKHNYLSSKEIELIRENYGLSQRGLATILNWSPSTVARYETGAIPSPAHHSTLITLKENIEYARDLFEKNRDKLGRLDEKRMKKRLDDYEQENAELDIVQLLAKKYKKIENPIYNGFTEFDFNKVSNIILYFCKEIPKVSKTKLMKLLFYADFRNYKEYGLSISGIAYKHLPYGPVPHHHWLMLDALTENKIIEVKPFESFEGEYLEVLTDPDLTLLDEDEIEVLKEVTQYFQNFNAEKISDYSHQEEAYKKTSDREFISYDFADDLREFK